MRRRFTLTCGLLISLIGCRTDRALFIFSIGASTADLYVGDLYGRPSVIASSADPEGFPAVGSHTGRVVYVRGERGSRDLWMLDSSGCSRQLTDSEGDESTPAWSPAEDFIFYTHTIGRHSQIMRISMKDGTVMRISEAQNSDAYPAVSRDGDMVAFHSYRDGAGRTALFLARLDGTSQRRLTEPIARDYEPEFSRDGRTVIFSSNRAGVYEIHAVDVATRSVTKITESKEDCWGPKALRDGKRVIYYCGTGADSKVYAASLDGSTRNPSRWGNIAAVGLAVSERPVPRRLAQGRPCQSRVPR